jgi:TRAP-type C4-dicarboxylate transport system substrate-binding protein
MNLLKTFAIALSTTSALAAAPSFAQTQWTMATGYPENSFFTENIRQFIDEVEEETGGALTIDLRANDTLIKHDAIKRAVQSGQVQIGEIRLAVYGNEGAMYDLDNLPGLVTTYDEAWKLMEAQKPFFDELFAENGMQILSYVAWPGQGFYTAEPVTSLEDLQGHTLRIYSRQTQTMGEMLGMDAIILPFAEVPQAFSTGLIESLWTSAQTGTDVQAWDYVDHFTYTGSMHNKNAIIVNAAAMQALDEETRNIVIAAGERATERGWELSKAASEEKEDELRENGMQIAQAPEDVMTRMQEIGEIMIAEWREAANEEEVAVLDAYRSSGGR